MSCSSVWSAMWWKVVAVPWRWIDKPTVPVFTFPNVNGSGVFGDSTACLLGRNSTLGELWDEPPTG